MDPLDIIFTDHVEIMFKARYRRQQYGSVLRLLPDEFFGGDRVVIEEKLLDMIQKTLAKLLVDFDVRT